MEKHGDNSQIFSKSENNFEQRASLIKEAKISIEAGKPLNYEKIAEKYGRDKEKVQGTIADVFNSMHNIHQELSQKFNDLRANIKLYNIHKKKIENLKNKIKDTFTSLSDPKKTNTTEILEEIKTLLGQLEYEINKNIEFKVDYKNERFMYKFTDDYGQISEGNRSRDELVRIGIDYTNKGKTIGAKFGQEEILDKYHLQPGERNVLRNKIRYLKLQEAIPPIIAGWMIRKRGVEKFEEIKNSYIDRALTVSAREGIKKSTEKKKNSLNNKLYMIMKDGDYQESKFIQFIQDNIQPWKVAPTKYKKFYNTYDIIAASDLHLGENTAINTAHLQNMMLDASEMGGKNLYIFFLGDMLENIVPGGMHLGQELAMDMLGFELMKYAADTISFALQDLRRKTGKEIYFYGITGNHDRGTPEKTLDPQRRFMLMIFNLIEQNLKNHKKIHIITKTLRPDLDTYYLSTDIPDDNKTRIHYAHGDNGFNSRAEKDPYKLLGNNYAPNKDNIIMSGDRHNLHKQRVDMTQGIIEKNENNLYDRKKNQRTSNSQKYNNTKIKKEQGYTKGKIHTLRVPALTTTNTYAKRNGYSSPSGYVHISRNRYGQLIFNTIYLGTLPGQEEKLRKVIDGIKQGVVWTIEDYSSIADFRTK